MKLPVSEASPDRDRFRINIGDRPPHDNGIETTSTWWLASAYNITAIVGLGVLVLPHAMVFLSWGGVVVLALACSITYFTLKQLVELHEVDPGIRYVTYHSLGQRAFGERLGLWIVLPMQIVVELSLDVLFTIAAGEAMIRILGDCHHPRRHEVPIYIWFVLFATIQVAISCVLPNYRAIKWIAVAAALMSICYSTIAWITLVSVDDPPRHPDYGLPEKLQEHNRGFHAERLGLSHPDLVLEAFNSIGVIAFAYAAHNVVLDIQSNLPSPSKKAMMKGVRYTYLVVALCYFPMGIAVYKVYGNEISRNVLGFMMSRVSPGWVITTNIMLIIHVIGSYQIFAIPVFETLEDVFFPNYPSYIIRVGYIASTTIIAIIFPYFSLLLGFFGGLVIAPTTYILPCVIWLRIRGYSNGWTRAHYINWVCIVLGILLMFLAIMGGISVLTKEMKIYSFYNLYRQNKWIGSGFYPDCTPTPTPSPTPTPT